MNDPPAVPAASPKPPADSSPSLQDKIPNHLDGIQVDVTGEDGVDRRLAEIEMEGEEVAAGWKPAPHQPLAPEVRFLHISRTIHQLITDRNRSVGIFLAVASLSFAASTALLNARADVVPIIPLKSLQYWCLPVTFGTLAIIGAFMCLILVRTRIGLIYEVSKMNALLGLPSERVKRVNPFSIFFLMYLMVCLCGAAAGGLASGLLMVSRAPAPITSTATEKTTVDDGSGAAESRVPLLAGTAIGSLYAAIFLTVYYAMVLNATSEEKLVKARG
jgi:hypothetical protein